LAHGLGKLKPKIENPGGNSLRLRLDLGCNAIAAAATASKLRSTVKIYPDFILM
jgi:hypothetical protein